MDKELILSMAKSRRAPFQTYWLVIPAVLIILLVAFLFLKGSTKPAQPEATSYQVYQNPQYGFTIEYPQAWEVRKETQVFENGDAIAFGISGPTQKKQTELTDGAQVVVSKPFSINGDVAKWVKEQYDNTSEFSQSTINGHTYQRVYTCGLGCMTFYYTLVNDEVYGIAVFAQGPDQDKMVYENTTLYMLKSLTFTAVGNGSISKEEAVVKVKMLPEVIEYLKRVPNGLVSVNGQEDDSYLIQVYEFKDGHTATFNWYIVDKQTGEITKQFDN